MYIIKNAWISIIRNKGRNLLIGIIIMVIAAAAAVTLAINNSASSLIESYAAQYETEATIGINRENMMQKFDPKNASGTMEEMKNNFSVASSLTVEDVKKYADSGYVQSFYYTESVGVDVDGLTAATSDFGGGDRGGPGGPGTEQQTNENESDFTLQGYSTIEAMSEFVSGDYTIVEGEITDDFDGSSCVLNSELATLNEISVGDKITVVDPDNTGNTLTLTVAGIYDDNGAQSEPGGGMQMFSNSANTIITHITAVEQLAAQDDSLSVTVTPTFVLTGSGVVESFEAELREKGLNENLTVETNLDQVENATSTISNVRSFAMLFLVITLVIGTIVLLVINMINVRERKYEIGVLRTIGMKKSLVSLQFVCELLMVSLMALVVGAGIGAALSMPVSNALLASEIESSQNQRQEINKNFGGGEKPDAQPASEQNAQNTDAKEGAASDANANDAPAADTERKFNGVVQVEAFETIDAVVDWKVLLELLGIGLAITLVGSISALIAIQRFSPLEILKERS